MGVADTCPYCGASRHSPTGYIKGMMRAAESGTGYPPLTQAIIYFTTIMFVAQLFVGMLILGPGSLFQLIWSGGPVGVGYVLGASTPEIYSDGQWYRLITASFLHGGLLHIGFNMFALFQVGPLIERTVGPWMFLFFYVLTGIGGFFLSSYPGFSGEMVVTGIPKMSLGASASLFGMIGSGMVIAFRLGQGRQDPIFNVLLQWSIFSLAMGFMIPNIDNLAHIGGLLSGLLLGHLWVQNRHASWLRVHDQKFGVVAISSVLLSFVLTLYNHVPILLDILSRP